MQRLGKRRRLGLAAGWAVMVLAGCEKSLYRPSIVSLVYVSGSDQAASIGDVLLEPLVVRVVDQDGRATAGVEVSFTVTIGNGAVTPEVATSGADGSASTSFRLGSGLGQQGVRASLGTASSVEFTAEALPAPPSQIVVVSGANQTATAGTQLPAPIVVRVTDAFNTPKAGITVEFGVVTGGGMVGAASALTDAQGQASVSWTLGPAVGAQTMTAVVAGVTPLIISATAQ